MMNILVTGGAGFIGSNFLNLLAPRYPDYRFINVDVLTYAANLRNLEALSGRANYAFEQVDIGDRDAVADLLDRVSPDLIVHFAAESHVDRSIHSPDAFMRTNIVGTFNLLEAVRARAARQRTVFHHVSTDEVYGSLGSSGAFVETTPYDPSSPYSASKAASDHLVRAYHRTYGLPVRITNCSNNYGPCQFPEKLIPLMILNAVDGKPLPVYGQGTNVRDWLYVTDHCEAIWAVIERDGSARPTTSAGERSSATSTSFARFAPVWPRKRAADVESSSPDHVRAGSSRSRSPLRDRSGQNRARVRLCPTETFESGLRKTVRFYLDHAEWVNEVRSGEYRTWIDRNYARRS